MEQKLKDIYTKNLLPHKKDIIKAAAKMMGIQRLFTFRSTVGWQQLAFIKYHKNDPNAGDRVICVGRAIHSLYVANTVFNGTGGRLSTGGITTEEQLELYEYVVRRWWEAIEKKSHKVKGIHNTITEDLKELLARGFVHYEDIVWEEEDESFIIKHIGTHLTYPKEFLSKNYAQEFLDKYGVYGCTILTNQ
jgi:hypothetical protein